MKELTISIRDTETGKLREKKLIVSDDALNYAAVTLAVKNAFTTTEVERSGMEIAAALAGTGQENKKS